MKINVVVGSINECGPFLAKTLRLLTFSSGLQIEPLQLPSENSFTRVLVQQTYWCQMSSRGFQFNCAAFFGFFRFCKGSNHQNGRLSKFMLAFAVRRGNFYAFEKYTLPRSDFSDGRIHKGVDFCALMNPLDPLGGSF